MPCDTNLEAGQSLASRNSEIQTALARLEASLTAGRVRVGIGQNGAIVFQGWDATERKKVTDVCAYRTLTMKNSWPLRQAVARAESLSGRKVNVNAVAAGTHSHDNGQTWHRGH